ncbi:VOC family protein [Brachybacterium halotolerans subsp. kimchii]|uniref:VOC family protein n=1 Tax=Brachybacterium halotolerans TaxID=2795215 RepID=UPI001E5B456F|nr:VOC family protein [Brachybacterium halotolerans]UEJ83452.1 VOC family protein [Brachybacterium halotolerans subsp. kimchii]
MGHVHGIGGFFLRATDPQGLTTWYRDVLGLDIDENGLWHQQAGPTVFAAFPQDTDYFGDSGQTAMLNLRVVDLDALRARLRRTGANVEDAVQEMEGVGRFGWVRDPEGNRIELWEPASPRS